MKSVVFACLMPLLLLLLLCCSCASEDGGEIKPDGDADVESDENDSATDHDSDFVEDGDSESGELIEAEGDEADYEELKQEAGFIEIEPISYYFDKNGDRQDLQSSRAFIWHTFQPAYENPQDKPLIVFFNGGPGSASGLLYGFNTGKLTLDPQVTGDKEIADNPASWNRLGNLLYIDARQTGFSYCTMDGVSDARKRADEFSARNFNSFFDAADFVRVLLRFLDAHPQIKSNPVIIAGESYGGIRSTVMLHLLQHYRRYDSGKSIFQDPALVDEIQAHVDKVFPDFAGTDAPPEIMASQFGTQVLIQPLLSGMYQDEEAGILWEQDGSPIFRIADESGTKYTPCRERGEAGCDPHNNALIYVMNSAGRDVYNYSQPFRWMDDISDIVTARLLKYSNLSEMTGIEASDIMPMYAENRSDAYRISYIDKNSSTAAFLEDRRIPLVDRVKYAARLKTKAQTDKEAIESGDLPDVFGVLMPWDRYYFSLQYLVNTAFYVNSLLLYGVDPFNPIYGELFLENLLYTKTFITNAAYDLVIYAAALPTALERHGNLVASVQWVQDAVPGEARGGSLTINYTKNAFGLAETPPPVKIRFPLYAKSCHAVEITEPDELLEDVEIWLNEETSLTR